MSVERAKNWETFPHAPIVEAVIDLRARLPSDVSVELLATLQSRISGEFPIREPQQEITAEFIVSPDAAAASSVRRPHGFRFLSEDRLWAVQMRLDGFTVNHLAPYTNWRTLREKAARLWTEYVGVARPTSVERIGLRYINRLFVPFGENLSDYFELEPRLGPQLPQTIVWSNVQLLFEFADVPATILVQQRRDADQPTHAGQAAVILDIDVFHERALSPEAVEVWSALDKFRDLKNEIFFNATTEKAKEAFR